MYSGPNSIQSGARKALAKPKKPKAAWGGVPNSIQDGMTRALHPPQSPPGVAQSAGAVPATAAQPATPHADPFLSPQNMMDLANFNFGQQTSIDEIDGGLRDLATQTAFQQTQVDDGARKSTSSTNDNAAARGIAQSSIRDGSLADIEAQRVLQKNYLSDQLSNAQIAGDARKAALATQATNFMKGMDGQAVSNADAINSQIEPPAPDPAPVAPAASAQPPVDKSKWVSNVAHVRGKSGTIFKRVTYADGHVQYIPVGK